jgi:hypothetical protein
MYKTMQLQYTGVFQQYFPKDRETWAKSMVDASWWVWLCTRLLGIYDLRSTTKTMLWLFSVVWFLWPVRYFFYYRFVSCTPGGVLASSGVDLVFETNNVFCVNMLGHASVLFVCCYLAYLLSLLKSPSSGIAIKTGKRIGPMLSTVTLLTLTLTLTLSLSLCLPLL